MSTGIYCIRNLFDGKEYVGSAARGFIKRWKLHILKLKQGIHDNYKLQAAWNVCGESAFSFDILEECLPEKCIDKEQEWIDALDPEYNICRIAGSCLGVKRSIATCAKISAALLGRVITPEWRAKMSEAHAGKPGHKSSPETNAKLRAANLGRKHSPEAIAKNRAAHLGRIPSPATLAKRSAAMMGHRMSLENREKLRVANLGRKQSPETIEKLRAIHLGNKYWLGKHHSPETRQKLRLVNLGKKLSLEHRAKIGASHLGSKRSRATCIKMSTARSLWWKNKKAASNRVSP